MTALDVKNLRTYYYTTNGTVKAAEDISFTLDKGDALGIVGESGSGKTTVALSLLNLLPPQAQIESGKIIYDGHDLLTLNEKELDRMIRWKKISFVFQSAMTGLNSVFSIGSQIVEAIQTHDRSVGKGDAWKRTEALLELVGIDGSRAHSYPHELSGGTRQRAFIAMALACNPEILIADEPTTALDVLIEAQIIALLRELKKKLNLTLILISHDLSLIAQVCNKAMVMYAGRIVESSDIHSLFKNPKHPYTQALIKAIPNINSKKTFPSPIPGDTPNLIDPPSGCRFHPRCPYVMDICRVEQPLLIQSDERQFAACHLLTQDTKP